MSEKTERERFVAFLGELEKRLNAATDQLKPHKGLSHLEAARLRSDMMHLSGMVKGGRDLLEMLS